MARGIVRTVLVFALLFALTGSDAAHSSHNQTQNLRTTLLLKSRPTDCIERQGPENVICSTRFDGPSYGPALKGMKYHSYHCGQVFVGCRNEDGSLAYDYWSIGARGEPDWLYGRFNCFWCLLGFGEEQEEGLFDSEDGPLAELPLPGVFWDRTSSHRLWIERGTGIFAGATGSGTLDCVTQQVKAYSYTCLLTLEFRRGFQHVSGRILAPTRAPCPTYASPEGDLEATTGVENIFTYSFVVDQETRGTPFSLKSKTKGSDIDLLFDTGTSSTLFATRKFGGESGIVPANAYEAHVCLHLGAVTSFVYKAGV